MTVSRAFRGKVDISDATRERIRQAAARLGYRPNHVARSLAEARTRTLGLVINPNLWVGDVVGGAEAAARELGYGLIYTTTPLAAVLEREGIETLRDRRVDGLLITSGSDMREHDHLIALHREGVPVVSINRYCEDVGFCRIFFDYRGSTRAVVRRLLAAGHRRVLFLGGAPDHPQQSVRERIEGYREGLREAGAWDADAEAFGGMQPEDGERLVETALRRSPAGTAMLMINDQAAAGALRALRRLGRRVPEDVAVVSLHDTRIAQCTDPPLTSIRHRTEEAGQIGCRLLMEQIQRPEAEARTLVLPSMLVVRRSCGLGSAAATEAIQPLD
jgi:DNA-binding LacI/PurR family transcriptional regulator